MVKNFYTKILETDKNLPFIVNIDDKTSNTYGEFLDEIDFTIDNLGARCQRIAILLPNRLEKFQALISAMTVGVAVPVNPLLANDAIISILKSTDVDTILTTSQFRSKIENIVSQTKEIEVKFIEEFERHEKTIEAPRKTPLKKVVAMFHTGGTTGDPKIVPLTLENILENGTMISKILSASSRDTFYCGLPLFHVNAVLVTLITPIISKSRVVFNNDGYRDSKIIAGFWDVVARYKVTYFSCVPTIISRLLSVDAKGNDLSSLKFALVGAAPLSVEVFNKFEEKTGVKILEGYGLTESTCSACVNPPTGQRKIGSVGIAYGSTEFKVIDKELNQCDPNKIGRILIRGKSVFQGYLCEKDNRDVWIDGWFDTGDLGKIDEENFIWITGRSKDLIIRGGHNIDPLYIEEVAFKHPNVKLAAAVGMPDEDLGEVPVCFVELNKKSSDEDASTSILSFLKENLDKQSFPKNVFVIDAMPLTPVGKVSKKDLRARLSE